MYRLHSHCVRVSHCVWHTVQGYLRRHGQPQEIASGPYQQYLFQITDANAESTCRDTPQKYLNAIHDANLLLQKDTDAYKTINAANKLSKKGFENRTKLCEESRNNPEFFLNFGPAGDLPIHLACLLQDGQLGIDMLEAVHYSHKIDDYYDRCNKLIEMYGQENMPPLREGLSALQLGECPRCKWVSDWRKGHGDAHLPAHLPADAAKHHENCKHWHVHRFIINIPYQNDIIWWLEEIERRKGGSGEVSESPAQIERPKKVEEGDLEKLLPDKIRQQMKDKGREAGLFSGLCVCWYLGMFTGNAIACFCFARI